MSFESGNLHVCGYETTDGTGVIALMGLSKHALKWDACNETIRQIFKVSKPSSTIIDKIFLENL